MRGLQQHPQEGGGTKVGGEGKTIQGRQNSGVPVGCTSPPIRDGVPHIAKLILHKPPLSTGTSSFLSLITKKNEGRKALSEHFDN